MRSSDNCLLSGADDPARPVLLLPVEAFGVVIDMVALEIFAGRDRRKSLCSSVDVLLVMKDTCLAESVSVPCTGATLTRTYQAR